MKGNLIGELEGRLNTSCSCIKKLRDQPFLLLKIRGQYNDISADVLNQLCSKCSNGFKLIENELDRHDQADGIENCLDGMKHKFQASKMGVSEIELSLKNLRRLKVLKMESCVNITDNGLSSGIDLNQLRELDIKLCTNLTGKFLDSHEDNFRILNNLKAINLNQCTSFLEENLYRILENSPNLKELSVSALPAINSRMVEVLLEQKKVLSLLDVSFCSNINESDLMRYEHFLYSEFGSREFCLDKRFINK